MKVIGDEDKVELLDFEYLLPCYNKKAVVSTGEQLQ